MRTALHERPHAARVAFALGLVYVVWGSTYLAIRVTVETLPPLTSAGIRFMIAGAIVYLLNIRRVPAGERPTLVHWRSAAIIGGALLLGGNGLVVLAEAEGVPSGIVALLVGTVPLWMALIGWLRYKERLGGVAIAGVLVGFSGVVMLAKPSGGFGVESLFPIAAALTWSAGSLYARNAPLPKAAFLATGMEMLAGGALQILGGAALGEWGDIDPSRFSRSSLVAFAYLIVFGSLIGFTAYIWLLGNARTSIVSTYAYVNPAIAVLLGAAFAGESIAAGDLLAGALIVGSVALIVAARHPPPVEASPADAPVPPEGAEDEAVSAG